LNERCVNLFVLPDHHQGRFALTGKGLRDTPSNEMSIACSFAQLGESIWKSC
jgi:hypothetical protein